MQYQYGQVKTKREKKVIKRRRNQTAYKITLLKNE